MISAGDVLDRMCNKKLCDGAYIFEDALGRDSKLKEIGKLNVTKIERHIKYHKKIILQP